MITFAASVTSSPNGSVACSAFGGGERAGWAKASDAPNATKRAVATPTAMPGRRPDIARSFPPRRLPRQARGSIHSMAAGTDLAEIHDVACRSGVAGNTTSFGHITPG